MKINNDNHDEVHLGKVEQCLGTMLAATPVRGRGPWSYEKGSTMPRFPLACKLVHAHQPVDKSWCGVGPVGPNGAKFIPTFSRTMKCSRAMHRTLSTLAQTGTACCLPSLIIRPYFFEIKNHPSSTLVSNSPLGDTSNVDTYV
jgi:hypothetical protein